MDWQSMSMRVTSGKRFLAFCAGLSLVILVVSLVFRGPKFCISTDALAAIITGVFIHYFKTNGADQKEGQ